MKVALDKERGREGGKDCISPQIEALAVEAQSKLAAVETEPGWRILERVQHSQSWGHSRPFEYQQSSRNV